ncbi:hypothetical protein [Dactylosporangium sp. NPDC048998]|uniref:MmyB family transcriptional regulator n=1 Tax=Dactylosporangium sp. NPDC048998 TaxID=3363976 RepID=UPI00371F1D33
MPSVTSTNWPAGRTSNHGGEALARRRGRRSGGCWTGSKTPAIVLGKRLDILGWNNAATALYLDFSALPVKERNYLRLMFLHPGFRALHREWEHDARTAVGAVRLEAAGNLHDSELTQLVGELSLRDEDFRTWWAQQQLSGRYQGVKYYRHALVGDLALDCDTWNSPDGTGQRLMVLTAEPGTPSADALRILTAWQEPREADRPEPQRAQ